MPAAKSGGFVALTANHNRGSLSGQRPNLIPLSSTHLAVSLSIVMSDPPNKVEEVAEKAIEKVIEPAAQETPSVAPSADKPAIATVVGAAQAVQDGLHAEQGTKPTYEPLPAYALQYAPLMWLSNEEQYWPGNPLEHLENCIPQHKNGALIEVPKDIFGKWDSLKIPAVNDPDVFLCLNVSLWISSSLPC